MFKRMSLYEIRQTYKHFTERNVPFEDEIIDIIPQTGVSYSERWDFLKSLVYVTSKGYYFTYEDVFGNNAHHDPKEHQPYEIFLEGALKCVYPYAFNAEVSSTLNTLFKILSLGKISVGKYDGKYSFTFTLSYYTYLPHEYRNN